MIASVKLFSTSCKTSYRPPNDTHTQEGRGREGRKVEKKAVFAPKRRYGAKARDTPARQSSSAVQRFRHWNKG